MSYLELELESYVLLASTLPTRLQQFNTWKLFYTGLATALY